MNVRNEPRLALVVTPGRASWWDISLELAARESGWALYRPAHQRELKMVRPDAMCVDEWSEAVLVPPGVPTLVVATDDRIRRARRDSANKLTVPAERSDKAISDCRSKFVLWLAGSDPRVAPAMAQVSEIRHAIEVAIDRVQSGVLLNPAMTRLVDEALEELREAKSRSDRLSLIIVDTVLSLTSEIQQLSLQVEALGWELKKARPDSKTASVLLRGALILLGTVSTGVMTYVSSYAGARAGQPTAAQQPVDVESIVAGIERAVAACVAAEQHVDLPPTS